MVSAWAILLRKFTKKGISFDVTWRDLTLGTRHAITGWRSKDFYESTINMIILTRGTSYRGLVPGVFVSMDGVGLTQSDVEFGDEIKDADGIYWEVKGQLPKRKGDTLDYYRVNLTELPLHV